MRKHPLFTPHFMKIILRIFLLIFSLPLFVPYSAEAASVNVDTTFNLSLMSTYSNFNTLYQFSNPRIGVVYNAEVRNADTNAVIANNASVDVGTKLKFMIPGDSSHSISWSGYGDSSSKSIYGSGAWDATVSAPSVTPGAWSCPGSYVDTFTNGLSANAYSVPQATWSSVKLYLYFSVKNTGRSIVTSGSMNCGSTTGNATSGYQVLCTVTGSGALKGTFTFPSTYGKFYKLGYHAHSSNVTGPGAVTGCYASTNPFTEYSPLWSYTKQLNNNEVPIATKTITFNLTGTPVVPKINGVC